MVCVEDVEQTDTLPLLMKHRAWSVQRTDHHLPYEPPETGHSSPSRARCLSLWDSGMQPRGIIVGPLSDSDALENACTTAED